ncbi:MAG TPA: hypothetical protein VNT60_05480 [Deinococcales bacterium]|nr:hypothetical protein [Deinococcales bacterium]
MRLEHLCDMELQYEKTLPGDRAFVLVRPYGGEEGRGYEEGTGTLKGERLSGEGRWVNHPRRRSDGVMQPDSYGLFRTADGADVFLSLSGRTLFPANGRGRQLLVALFESEHEAYRWLNDTMCVVEGNIDPARLRMTAKVYECVHDLS